MIAEDPHLIDGKHPRDGSTPLHKAAQRRDLGGAVLLLANGAQLDAADNQGNTPLHAAILVGRSVCVCVC